MTRIHIYIYYTLYYNNNIMYECVCKNIYTTPSPRVHTAHYVCIPDTYIYNIIYVYTHAGIRFIPV